MLLFHKHKTTEAKLFHRIHIFINFYSLFILYGQLDSN